MMDQLEHLDIIFNQCGDNNSLKYTFGVIYDKFLGFIIWHTGNEVDHRQDKGNHRALAFKEYLET